MEVKDSNFKKDVLQSEKLVLVDFWATWCMPCQMLKPTIEEIGNEMKDKVDVRTMDIDENPNTAQEYNIMSVPAVLFFKNGELVDTVVGMHPKDTYVKVIEELA